MVATAIEPYGDGGLDSFVNNAIESRVAAATELSIAYGGNDIRVKAVTFGYILTRRTRDAGHQDPVET